MWQTLLSVLIVFTFVFNPFLSLGSYKDRNTANQPRVYAFSLYLPEGRVHFAEVESMDPAPTLNEPPARETTDSTANNQLFTTGTGALVYQNWFGTQGPITPVIGHHYVLYVGRFKGVGNAEISLSQGSTDLGIECSLVHSGEWDCFSSSYVPTTTTPFYIEVEQSTDIGYYDAMVGLVDLDATGTVVYDGLVTEISSVPVQTRHLYSFETEGVNINPPCGYNVMTTMHPDQKSRSFGGATSFQIILDLLDSSIPITYWDTALYLTSVNLTVIDLGKITLPYSEVPDGQAYAPGDCEFGCGNYQGWAGDPINTASGNFHYENKDISVEALGGPIYFNRSYNAQSVGVYTGSLGAGWTHNYDVYLVPGTSTDVTRLPGESGTVIIKGLQGSLYRFFDSGITAAGTITYDAFPGVWATLTRTLDAAGAITYVAQSRDRSTYIFTATNQNSIARLVSLQEPVNHRALTLSYEDDRLTRVSDAGGQRYLNLSYDSQGKLVQVADPLSRTVDYTYNITGDLATVTDTRGFTWTHTYTGEHKLSDIVDPLGNLVKRTNYDSEGRATQQLSAASEDPLQLDYGANGTVTVTDSMDHQRVDYYDHRGTLVAQSGVMGAYTRTYDFDFNAAVATDANGHSVWRTYNEQGLPETVVDALGASISVSYTERGVPAVITDANSGVTRYEYEGTRLITMTDAQSGTVVNTYDAAGFLVQVVDHGITATYDYYDTGELKTFTDSVGVTRYEYDAVGRLITTTLPGNRMTVNVYDKGNHLLQVTRNYTSAGGQNYLGKYNLVTTYEYDAVGRQIAMTNTLNQVSRQLYDNAGRLISSTTNFSETLYPNHGSDNLWNLTTLYGYDAMGRQIVVTGANGLVNRSWYNGLGLLVSSTVNYSPTIYPDQGADHLWNQTTFYEYDPVGNQVAVTDAKGLVTHFEYNGVNQLIAQTVNYTSSAAIPYPSHGTDNAWNLVTSFGYDKAGNRVAITDTKGYVTAYGYDRLNRLVSQTVNFSPALSGHGPDNAWNLTTLYGYDAQGNQALITDTVGNVTRNFYNSAGQLISVTANYSSALYPEHGTDLAWNLTTVYEYDPVTGNRRVVTEADGLATRYGYSEIGQLISTTAHYTTALPLNSGDWNLTTWYEYNIFGNQVRVTDTLGRVTFTEYDLLNRPVTVTRNYTGNGVYDPAHPDYNLVEVTTYNAAGQVWTVKKLRGDSSRTLLYEYDPIGRPVTVTQNYQGNGLYDPAYPDRNIKTVTLYNAQGQVEKRLRVAGTVISTTYDYDALGRVITTTDALSGTTVNHYDLSGQVLTATDAAENSNYYAYNAAGQVLTTTQGPTRTTESYHDAMGRVVAQVDLLPEGVRYTTTYTYHCTGRLVQVSNPLSEVVTYTYNLAGQQTAITDADSIGIYFAYDDFGRLVSSADELGNTTAYAYDRDGNRTLVTNALGISTRYEYDWLGHLIAVTENYSPTGPQDQQTNVRTVYGYDGWGNLTAITDGLTHTTVFTYDQLGRQIATADPNQKVIRYQYDGFGRRVNVVYPNAQNPLTVTTEFNALGWPEQIVYPAVGDIPAFTVTMSYDALGHRSAMTDATGVITYNYDTLYQPWGIQAAGEEVQYTYDALGRRQNLIYPTGEVVTYTHDPAGRLTRVDWVTNTVEQSAFYTYTRGGRLQEMSLPNGVVMAYGYDLAGRLIEIEYSKGEDLLARYEYGLDGLGNRIAVTETVVKPDAGLAVVPTYPLNLGLAAATPANDEPAPFNTNSPTYPVDPMAGFLVPLMIGAVLARNRKYRRWAGPVAGLLMLVIVAGMGMTLTMPVEASVEENHPLMMANPVAVQALPGLPQLEETPIPGATEIPVNATLSPTEELPDAVAPVDVISSTAGLTATSEITGNLGGLTETLGAETPSDWLSRVQANIQRSEYQVSWQAETHRPNLPAAYQAPNRAHNLRTYFTSTGILLVPRQDSSTHWDLWMSLSGYGYRGNLQSVTSTAALSSAGNIVNYQRSAALTEWYLNDERGLEQGFTLSAAPHPRGNADLVVELAISTTLRATLNGDIVEFTDAIGKLQVRYSGLEAYDARQKRLPTHLELEGNLIRLVVEDTGAVYPITIDPLLNSPAWTAESDQTSAFLGHSVRTAGDVNGDGYSDVIVGAYLYDNGQTDEGRAYLYYGSASGLSITPAWTVESNQASAYLGNAVHTAGDVNGDGYADVLVAAYQYDTNQTDAGVVYGFYGSANGLSATPDVVLTNGVGGTEFGYAVASAGDVNGDGYGDVIAGADNYTNGQTGEGAVYVYYGSSTGIQTTGEWRAESDSATAYLGYAVGGAGDVNGDGYADIIAGARGYDNGQTDEGAAYVYYGSGTGMTTTGRWLVEADQASAYEGCSVGTAGDVNGDGYADVIVGARQYTNGQSQEGQALVYYGAASGLPQTPAWTVESNQVSAYLGNAVGTAGDVNGDGYADVLIGAQFYDNGQADEGRAFVYYGSSNGLATTADWTAESDQASALLGFSVGAAGDVNGDGYADVVIGSSYYDNGQADEGRAFVYYGAPAGLKTTPHVTLESDQAEAHFGISPHAAGDVNGDGYGDVIVGAYLYDNGETNEGRVFLYYGSASGLSSSFSWSAEGNQAEAYFGFATGTAGDVNGDGYVDVVVSALYYDNDQTNEGRVYVYYGSANGLSATPDWIESNSANSNFGCSIGTAGDVNGDGYSDVLVGANTYGNGQYHEGKAYLYYGSASGLITTPVWTLESDVNDTLLGAAVGTAGDVNGDGYSDIMIGAEAYSSGYLYNNGVVYVYYGSVAGLQSNPWMVTSNKSDDLIGSSVSTAGDVNGDGYADVLIGARRYDSGQTDEGKAFVYYGSADGLSTTANWTAESNQAYAEFGASVSTAGDVNGDGYSDVIVGAYAYDNGQVDEGRAFVYFGSSSGLSTTVDWGVESDQAGAYLGTVSTAGDVNGDGYADILIGVDSYDNGSLGNAGRVQVYYGNGGQGVGLAPRQRASDDSASISGLGHSDRSDRFDLAVRAWSPFGRGKVKLEWQVAPLGTFFTSTTGVISGMSANWTNALASGVNLTETVTGLTAGTAYHWRLRLRYDQTTQPFQQYSRWFTPVWNGPQEQDLRTANTPVVEKVINYVYDPLGRLVDATYSTGEQFTYQYDAVGNRVAMTDTAGTHSYTYDAANRLILADGQTYTWDDRGNLLSNGIFTYTYDGAGRMVKAQSITATTIYTYNADGLRMALNTNGVVTSFVWDTAQPLAQVLSTSDGKRDIYGLGRLAEWQDAAWAYPLADALGSVRQWTDDEGSVTYAVGYEPFGDVLWQYGTTSSDWGFTGEWWDSSSEMLYLRARWYQPDTGRFTQVDTWEGDYQEPLTINPYLYVVENPVNKTDPTGHCPVSNGYQFDAGVRQLVYSSYRLGDFWMVLYDNGEVWYGGNTVLVRWDVLAGKSSTFGIPEVSLKFDSSATILHTMRVIPGGETWKEIYDFGEAKPGEPIQMSFTFLELWGTKKTILMDGMFPLPTSGYEVSYGPDPWNSSDIALSSGNCYSYALDDNAYSKHKWHPPDPGDISRYPITEDVPTCASLSAAAIADGLREINRLGECSRGEYKVALAMGPIINPYPGGPYVDYHWYRQNSDGSWSHKPGGQQVTDVDASGNKIVDPMFADRAHPEANYKEFCGYFCVKAHSLEWIAPSKYSEKR